jgi:hypothetical protein
VLSTASGPGDGSRRRRHDSRRSRSPCATSTATGSRTGRAAGFRRSNKHAGATDGHDALGVATARSRAPTAETKTITATINPRRDPDRRRAAATVQFIGTRTTSAPRLSVVTASPATASSRTHGDFDVTRDPARRNATRSSGAAVQLSSTDRTTRSFNRASRTRRRHGTGHHREHDRRDQDHHARQSTQERVRSFSAAADGAVRR